MKGFKGGPASSSVIFANTRYGKNIVAFSVEMSTRNSATDFPFANTLISDYYCCILTVLTMSTLVLLSWYATIR